MPKLNPTLLPTIALAATLQAALPAGAQEWTRFRGPNGTGISTATTVPVTFTEADYNWKVDFPGVGHSSPVVWGKKLFLTSAEEARGKRHVFCIDTGTGKPLWTRTYDFTKYTHHQYNSSASSTPAVDAEHVYVVWPTPEKVTLYALDHSGKDAWKHDVGAYPSQHGGASSPIVLGELVILAHEPDTGTGVLVALDRKTGQVRWKKDRATKNAAYATPTLYQPKDGPPELIFVSTASGMTSLDPKTGEVNWEVPGIFKQRCIGGAVVAGDVIFGTAGDGAGNRQGVAVRPGPKNGSKREAAVAYQVPRGVCYVPQPIVINDLLFMWGDAGVVTCLRASTGEQVYMERVGGNFFGSPIAVNGKLCALSALGELVVIDAGEKFNLVGRIPLGEASHATPAIADGVMYLRTESHLISVGGKKQ